LYTGERVVAFVDEGMGRTVPHEVRLGARGQGYVQVLEGLGPGDRVVTSAQFLLDSESNLAEVMRAMMAQMNMSDMEDMDGMEGAGGADGTDGMDGMDMGETRPIEGSAGGGPTERDGPVTPDTTQGR
jgi:Cu(I)/Ag(I) efflux system membrane fusion protein